MSTLKIEKTDKKIIVTIDATNAGRNDMRTDIVKMFFPKPEISEAFINLPIDPVWQIMLTQLIVEISKNIYDHGNRSATIEIWVDDKRFNFNFIDSNSAIIDLKKSKAEWQKKTPENFGTGLGMIKNMLETIFDTYEIDTSKGGVNYSGFTKDLLNKK